MTKTSRSLLAACFALGAISVTTTGASAANMNVDFEGCGTGKLALVSSEISAATLSDGEFLVTLKNVSPDDVHGALMRFKVTAGDRPTPIAMGVAGNPAFFFGGLKPGEQISVAIYHFMGERELGFALEAEEVSATFQVDHFFTADRELVPCGQ
ncbi:hypothetical protein [uncultured Tateyamaria sp.]|uniref:hypothetical protein n=1 Tax=uncultured Tateyamaria sp. TaxID=455651 RepID=UPI00262862C8|nr:hypothetical protein [uncultured Tateyamaria sp.]